MADVEFTVTGLAELSKKLKEMPIKLAKNGLRAAVNAGAEVIRKDAKARVPVKTGNVRKNIYKKQIREKSNNFQQTYYVGVKLGRKRKLAPTKLNVRKQRVGQLYDVESSAYYWRFLEFGTSKLPARPFLRPAFDTKKSQAVDAMAKKLKERIDKYAGEK